MRYRESDNLMGELLTVRQAADVTNLGTATVRKIAEQAGAVRKIGGCVRVNRAIFLRYIDSEFAAK